MLNSIQLQGNVASEHKNISTSGALFTLCSQTKVNEKPELQCLIKLSKLLSTTTFEIMYLEFQKLLVILK